MKVRMAMQSSSVVQKQTVRIGAKPKTRRSIEELLAPLEARVAKSPNLVIDLGPGLPCRVRLTKCHAISSLALKGATLR